MTKRNENTQKTQICVYMVKCSDGTIYTGWSNDVTSRVEAHNNGAGARYTKSRRPVTLIYVEGKETKSDALKRERQIKRFTRDRKLKLAAAGQRGQL